MHNYQGIILLTQSCLVPYSIIIIRVFPISISRWFFHWSLSDNKSPQVSRTLLSILAVLNDAVVWVDPTRRLTSKSSSSFSNPLVSVPNAPITIGIIVNCMFHSFFQFPSKVEVIILLSFFQFYSMDSGDSKVDNFANFLFFFLDYLKDWSSGQD